MRRIMAGLVLLATAAGACGGGGQSGAEKAAETARDSRQESRRASAADGSSSEVNGSGDETDSALSDSEAELSSAGGAEFGMRIEPSDDVEIAQGVFVALSDPVRKTQQELYPGLSEDKQYFGITAKVCNVAGADGFDLDQFVYQFFAITEADARVTVGDAAIEPAFPTSGTVLAGECVSGVMTAQTNEPVVGVGAEADRGAFRWTIR